MEISQGTPCITTIISNKLKYHVFHFIYSFVSSTKSGNRRAEQVFPGEKAGTNVRGE
jgi:hypothetical protein